MENAVSCLSAIAITVAAVVPGVVPGIAFAAPIAPISPIAPTSFIEAGLEALTGIPNYVVTAGAPGAVDITHTGDAVEGNLAYEEDLNGDGVYGDAIDGIEKVVTVTGAVASVGAPAYRELNVISLPNAGESITIGQCVVTFDNTADDLNCSDNAANVSRMELDGNMTRTPFGIAWMIRLLRGVYDAQHGALSTSGGGTFAVFSASLPTAGSISFTNGASGKISNPTDMAGVPGVEPIQSVDTIVISGDVANGAKVRIGGSTVITFTHDVTSDTDASDGFASIIRYQNSVPDTTAPTVSVSSHADGAHFTGSTLTLTGTALDGVAVASVAVNGIPAVGTGSWSVGLPDFAVGTGSVTVVATDAAGNTGSVTYSLVRDPDYSTAFSNDNTTYYVDGVGGLWSWGLNTSGQLGDGSTVSKSVPVRVLTGVVTAGTSDYLTTYALKADGTLWAWGKNNFGQVGDGSTTTRTTPYQALTGVVSFKVNGLYAVYALKADGTLWVWGHSNGKIGTGLVGNQLSPAQILTGVSRYAADSLGGAAVKADGSLSAWGYLSNGRSSSTLSISQMLTGAVVPQTRNGMYYGLKSDGSLWAWGEGIKGEAGNGTSGVVTSPARALTGASQLVLNYGTAFAIKQDGTLWGWGLNTNGQVGDGTTTNRSTPAQVLSGVRTVIHPSVQALTTYAIKNDGSLWAWGANNVGQAADGTTVTRTTPSQVTASAAKFLTFSAAGYALGADGALSSWGYNTNGQSGDGSNMNRTTPYRVMTGVSDAAAGYATYALKSDGTLWSWGYNPNGQVGDGTTADRTSATQVLTGVRSILAASQMTVLVIKSDDTLWSWGNNANGQVGAGYAGAAQTSPVRVLIDVAAPTVSVLSHASGAHFTGSGLTLTGTASDDLGVVSVTVNGVPATGTGAWSATLEGLTVSPNAVTVVVMDAAGNTATVALTVVRDSDVVLDTAAPVVTLNGEASMAVALGSVFADPGATWTDNMDGSGTIASASTGSVDVTRLGTYVLEYAYVDAAGNVGSATRTVTVADLTAPTITIAIPEDGVQLTGAIVQLNGFAVDNVGVVSVAVNGVTASGTDTWSATFSGLVLGANAITVTATDAAGNTGTGVLSVTRVATHKEAVSVFRKSMKDIDALVKADVADNAAKVKQFAADAASGTLAVNTKYTADAAALALAQKAQTADLAAAQKIQTADLVAAQSGAVAALKAQTAAQVAAAVGTAAKTAAQAAGTAALNALLAQQKTDRATLAAQQLADRTALSVAKTAALQAVKDAQAAANAAQQVAAAQLVQTRFESRIAAADQLPLEVRGVGYWYVASLVAAQLSLAIESGNVPLQAALRETFAATSVKISASAL